MHKIDGSDPQHAPNMASSCLPALGEYGAAGYCQGAMAERELPEKGLPHSTCCLYVVRIDFVRANHVWTWRKGRRTHDLGSCAHRRQQLHCVQLWNVYLLCRYMLECVRVHPACNLAESVYGRTVSSLFLSYVCGDDVLCMRG